MSAAIGLLAALALPILAGWLGLAWLVGPPARSPLAWLGRAAVAAMVGLGLSSLTTFAWLLAGGALDGRYVAFDAAALAGVAVLAFLRRRPASTDVGAGATRASSGWDRRLGFAAVAALGVAAVTAAWAGAQLYVDAPHGQWDAWVIWNLRARFLLRAGTSWRLAFAPDLYWSQTPYPLFMPLVVARLWAYAGETTLAPAALAVLSTTGVSFALAAAVASAAGPLAGGLAGLLVLAAPGFVATGAMQYADVPLAGFVVAGMAALVASGASERRARVGTLALGGVLLGIAGWTKNEGVAAALACVFAATLRAWRARGLRAALGDLLAVAAGAALPAAAWITFRSALAPSVLPLYLNADQTTAGLRDKLVDAGRWSEVLAGVFRRLPGIGFGFPAIAVAAALVAGSRPRALVRSAPLVAAALLLVADVITFVATTFDLQWHLGTAADRLVLQAWPLLLLALFTAVEPAAAGGAGAVASAAEPTLGQAAGP